MKHLKAIMSIFLSIPMILQCMEQNLQSAPTIEDTFMSRGSIRASDINEIFFEQNEEYKMYRGILINNMKLIAIAHCRGFRECYRSCFPHEEKFFDLKTVALPTYYFDMLEQLFKKQKCLPLST